MWTKGSLSVDQSQASVCIDSGLNVDEGQACVDQSAASVWSTVSLSLTGVRPECGPEPGLSVDEK